MLQHIIQDDKPTSSNTGGRLGKFLRLLSLTRASVSLTCYQLGSIDRHRADIIITDAFNASAVIEWIADDKVVLLSIDGGAPPVTRDLIECTARRLIEDAGTDPERSFVEIASLVRGPGQIEDVEDVLFNLAATQSFRFGLTTT